MSSLIVRCREPVPEHFHTNIHGKQAFLRIQAAWIQILTWWFANRVFQQVMATLFSSYVKDGNNSACLVQLL
jgi:hypothetical protein